MTPPFAAVIGWPANHSLSPVMMRRWLEEAGLPGAYGRVEAHQDHFDAFVRALPQLGWAGVNVTLPHKTAALRAADVLSEEARTLGAANLLTVKPDGNLYADNTDIVGVSNALKTDDGHGPATLIGAGGAAAAALYHLSGQDRDIRLVNRTRLKAEALAARYDRPIEIYNDLEPALEGTALVINATSLGMAGRATLAPDLSQTADDALVFDMVYTPVETKFLQAARASGRRTADGLEMLIGQARPSFEAFYGAPPPTGLGVKTHLLEALGLNP